jgi:thioredoxin reductase (NADPH)
MTRSCDVAVVGAGVAGLTAAFFAARYGLETLVVDHMGSGGQVLNCEKIENFPGFPNGVAGYELGPILQEQAEAAGADLLIDQVESVESGSPHTLVLAGGEDITAGAVIVAAGSSLKTLGVPGEEALRGRGISHCASCDGSFFQDEVVGVVGGGDSALDEALVLTEYASSVIIFVRDGDYGAQEAIQRKVRQHPGIDTIWHTEVLGVLGHDSVTGVRIRDVRSGEEREQPLGGLFIYVGLTPNTSFLEGLLTLESTGHIPTNIWLETEVPGVFAAGDIRKDSASLLASAAGDGATAAIAAFRYLSNR